MMEKSGVLADRRRYPRFPVCKKSLALLGEQQGEICDVSRGGLGVRFKGCGRLPDTSSLRIQMLEEDFYLSETPVTVVPLRVLEEEMVDGCETAQRCGVAFAELSRHQRFRLDYFFWLATGQAI